MPAKVEAPNTQARKTAEVFGALLGAVGGGVIGHNVGNRAPVNTALGATGGAVAGGALGSLVPGEVLVDGVSITYEDHGQTFNSAQVGRLCEFVPGKAIEIASSPRETRIQPNASCPTVAAK